MITFHHKAFAPERATLVGRFLLYQYVTPVVQVLLTNESIQNQMFELIDVTGDVIFYASHKPMSFPGIFQMTPKYLIGINFCRY